jgi:class 3 adenylate cyclase
MKVGAAATSQSIAAPGAEVAAMICEPVYRGICIVDIEGFSRHYRKNPTRVQMREALFRMFHQGLRNASIRESERVLKDLGDGILALILPQVSKPRLIHPLVSDLVTALEDYNRQVGSEARIRLRVAVHAGDVVPHAMDHIGEDLNHAFRLLDSKVLRRRLADTEAPLALIVSELIYDCVVKQGYLGIDPAAFDAVHFMTKEGKRVRAWIWTP